LQKFSFQPPDLKSALFYHYLVGKVNICLKKPLPALLKVLEVVAGSEKRAGSD